MRSFLDMRTALRDPRRWWLLAFIALFGVVLIRTAWVSDDAYISFRAVDQFVHGNGMCYNAGERVQVFTHPLWFLLMSAAYVLSGEVYFTSLALSMAMAFVATAVLAFRIARSARIAAWCVLALTFSRAFVEYSTSGLENPLTCLLLALYFLEYRRALDGGEGIVRLVMIAGLCVTNRMDTALLLVPSLAYAVAGSRSWRVALAAALGMAPFVLWEIVAIVYYGFPFPNPAYAKLGAGIPRLELLVQGGWYFLDSIRRDPLTLFVVACGIVLPLATGNRRNAAFAAGALLYLVYTEWIGGDFMSGRFFQAPLFCAVLTLADLDVFRGAWAWGAAYALVLIPGLIVPAPVVFSGRDFATRINACDFEHGVIDTRKYCYYATGLLWAFGDDASPKHVTKMRRETVSKPTAEVCAGAGIGPFYAHRQTYCVDVWSITDPLRARFPKPTGIGWTPGHIARPMPRGYLEGLPDGKNSIADPVVAEYYGHILEIVRGPVFSCHRFMTILRMNLGCYDHLIATTAS